MKRKKAQLFFSFVTCLLYVYVYLYVWTHVYVWVSCMNFFQQQQQKN